MRKNSFYIGTGMLGMWLFAACSQDGVPDNGASGSAEMRIYTDVARADGEKTDAGSTADNPVFLFWDFGDVLGNVANPTPLYVKQPKNTLIPINVPMNLTIPANCIPTVIAVSWLQDMRLLR